MYVGSMDGSKAESLGVVYRGDFFFTLLAIFAGALNHPLAVDYLAEVESKNK
jgi:hypothetical protein